MFVILVFLDNHTAHHVTSHSHIQMQLLYAISLCSSVISLKLQIIKPMSNMFFILRFFMFFIEV